MNKSYDIIGDLHGHADPLRALLRKLGYSERGGAYRHPSREAIFVGDFIDRGPKIRETLQIIRRMVDEGHALAVLGNHEWNALRYHTRGPDGAPLRPHTAKNEAQHLASLKQVAEPFPDEWAGWLRWFKSLPLFLDLGGLRVVHAAWCASSIGFVGAHRFVDDDFLLNSNLEGAVENIAVKALLNGPEVLLPSGRVFTDKEGHAHEDIRARWFGPPYHAGTTYRDLVFPPSDDPPALAVPQHLLDPLAHYEETEPPVVFGHYWHPPMAPRALAKNAACVDYSVASKRGGLLVAYRWDGECGIEDAKFLWVSSKDDGGPAK